ncbi:hypothetical protein [Rhodobacter lacus]|uniref:Uncharacterized protein n=1 Tax=Rhodobacter lacus TaxID=1641972 RepID=A0ABW5ABK3_9RHOB
MKLHYPVYDFRKGRLGPGMNARQDTKAYSSSVAEAQNMMVLADGRLMRRWGTFARAALAEGTRIEEWVFADGDETSFLLCFSPGVLKILDGTLIERASFTDQPWTAETTKYLQFSANRDTGVITDATFRTKFLKLDTETGAFTLTDFAFDQATNETAVYAPFFAFADEDMQIYATIFTSAGYSSGYANHVATALGIPATLFDLAAGTGILSTDDKFFKPGHVGSVLKIRDGQAKILSVESPKTATIQVLADIGFQLDTNPFYFTKNSSIVEVFAPKHNLRVGDYVFFAGVDQDDGTYRVLSCAPRSSYGGEDVPAPYSGAACYTVKRILDDSSFQIDVSVAYRTASAFDAEAKIFTTGPLTKWNMTAIAPNFDASSETKAAGGTSVVMFVFQGMRGVSEPAFSDVRGWPQAGCFHESRLWLGGTASLPDAVWGSRAFKFSDFDTADGEAADAVALYGIGQQSRVRHIVSGFDLAILTDRDEIYLPGSVDSPITQSTARAVVPTSFGSSYTKPQRFDGSIIYSDIYGRNLRDFSAKDRTTEYTAPPISIAVPDWVRQPFESAVFKGSANEVTPYAIFCNSDGTALVMHSAREDDAMGFMLWSLKNGSFKSFAGLGGRLFAVAERKGATFLLEFATDFATTQDFAETLSGAASTDWASEIFAGETLSIHSGGRVFSDVELDTAGAFSTQEALDAVTIGDAAPWSMDFHPPVLMTGMGPKMGKIVRLVSAEVYWSETATGKIAGRPILSPLDNPIFEAPTPVDEWRQYFIGEWGRAPALHLEGAEHGTVGVRSVVMNGYLR